MLDQLNMFESGDLISGTNALNKLHWEKGLKMLHTAKPVQQEDREFLLKAIDSGVFWNNRLKEIRSLEKEKTIQWNELLKDFQEFEFPDRLSSMKRNLLRYMVDQMIKEENLNYDRSIQAFLLLEKERIYDQAVKLMNACLQLAPQHFKLYYLLAQAEWRNEENGKAKMHYLQAFLYYPDRLMLVYVEDQRLKGLADFYPIEMIPAYAWLKGITSFVPVRKEAFVFLHKAHQLAFEAYLLLKQCDEYKKDKAHRLRYRKKLKKIAPLLFKDYMKVESRLSVRQ